jgi:microcystin-dependent protein
MDRIISSTGELLASTDICNTNRFAMIGIGKLAEAILGTGVINGFECTPTGPATLFVNVAAGEGYFDEVVDANAYGSLTASAQEISKQSIYYPVTNPVGPFAAPGTGGFSTNYLIQVSYLEDDNTAENRAFYNAAPQLVDTIRSDKAVLSIVAGTPAATGTQTTPAPTAGAVGAWVITVANGQTQIQAGDIARYDADLFCTEKLNEKISQTTADARYARLDAAIPTGTTIESHSPRAPEGFLPENGAAVSRTTYVNLFNALTEETTCTITNASASVTITTGNTDNLVVGMFLEGTGIVAGTKILTVDSSTTYTMDANANASNTGVSVRAGSYAFGNGTTTFNVPDTRGRSSIGSGQGSGLTNRIPGQTGGEELHTMTLAELATHAHEYTETLLPGTGANIAGGANFTIQTTATPTGNAGSSTPFNVMHPFYVVRRYIKT